MSATRIRDLRRTELVVRAGRVYRMRDLYAAADVVRASCLSSGWRPRPDRA